MRIIIGNFDETMARKVFCSAIEQNMVGSRIVWIILGNYDSNWWRIRDPGLTCSASQLQRALDGYIMTDILPVSSLNTQTISTRVSQYNIALKTINEINKAK